jgi:hypothetical protein
LPLFFAIEALGFGTSAIPPSAGSSPASMFSTTDAGPVPPQEIIKQAHNTIVIQSRPVRMCGRYTVAPATQLRK